MRSEQTKGVDEVAVFLRFIEQGQIPIELDSIEKRHPPEPDILCVHKLEGSVAFEIVELCDQSLAKAFANGSGEYIRTSDPSAGIVAKKLRRKYQSVAPIELLCHTAGRIITPDDVILPTVKPYLRSWRHVFRRAWLLGRNGVYEIWKARTPSKAASRVER